MLSDMYGAKFSQTFGAKPGAMWRKVIAELTDEQIATGMDSLMQAGSAFPPSLPEFRAACQSAEAVGEDEVHTLAYELIPSFDRSNCSAVAIEAMTRRNLPRARAILTGEAIPGARERNVLARIGLSPSNSLTVRDEP